MAAPLSPATPRNPWIVSKRFDLTMFLTPLALASLSPLTLLMPGGKDVPLWAFVFVIVVFDVAHVYASLYRTYLDPEEFGRRPLLYLVPIPLFVLASFRLHLLSSSLFWTILAYIAIYHFIKQNYGYLSLYKARWGEHSILDYHLDWWTIWVGALGPILWWHASPKRQFDWFHAGERFILHLDSRLEVDVMVLYVAFALLYLWRQVYLYKRDGHVNPGKNLVMIGNWVTWWIGIRMFDHPLISAAFLNLFHGIPFLMTVWWCGRRRWGRHGPDTNLGESSRERFLVSVFSAKTWLPYFLPLFALALAEEFVWDGLVWGQYLPDLTRWTLPSLSPAVTSLLVAVLSLPQILHYFLDAWIWKLDGSNPGLHELLGLSGMGATIRDSSAVAPGIVP